MIIWQTFSSSQTISLLYRKLQKLEILFKFTSFLSSRYFCKRDGKRKFFKPQLKQSQRFSSGSIWLIINKQWQILMAWIVGSQRDLRKKYYEKNKSSKWVLKCEREEISKQFISFTPIWDCKKYVSEAKAEIHNYNYNYS